MWRRSDGESGDEMGEGGAREGKMKCRRFEGVEVPICQYVEGGGRAMDVV